MATKVSLPAMDPKNSSSADEGPAAWRARLRKPEDRFSSANGGGLNGASASPRSLKDNNQGAAQSNSGVTTPIKSPRLEGEKEGGGSSQSAESVAVRKESKAEIAERRLKEAEEAIQNTPHKQSTKEPNKDKEASNENDEQQREKRPKKLFMSSSFSTFGKPKKNSIKKAHKNQAVNKHSSPDREPCPGEEEALAAEDSAPSSQSQQHQQQESKPVKTRGRSNSHKKEKTTSKDADKRMAQSMVQRNPSAHDKAWKPGNIAAKQGTPKRRGWLGGITREMEKQLEQEQIEEERAEAAGETNDAKARRRRRSKSVDFSRLKRSGSSIGGGVLIAKAESDVSVPASSALNGETSRKKKKKNRGSRESNGDLSEAYIFTVDPTDNIVEGKISGSMIARSQVSKPAASTNTTTTPTVSIVEPVSPGVVPRRLPNSSSSRNGPATSGSRIGRMIPARLPPSGSRIGPPVAEETWDEGIDETGQEYDPAEELERKRKRLTTYASMPVPDEIKKAEPNGYDLSAVYNTEEGSRKRAGTGYSTFMDDEDDDPQAYLQSSLYSDTPLNAETNMYTPMAFASDLQPASSTSNNYSSGDTISLDDDKDTAHYYGSADLTASSNYASYSLKVAEGDNYASYTPKKADDTNYSNAPTAYSATESTDNNYATAPSKPKKASPSKKASSSKKADIEISSRDTIQQTSPDLLKKVLVSLSGDDSTQLSDIVDMIHKEEKAKEKAALFETNVQKHRDWNKEYQPLFDKGVASMDKVAIEQVSELGHDFVRCAEIYAKIIINELALPDELKTIRPANIGGIAGGEKFIVHGILFKFCLDQLISTSPPMYMYGGTTPCDEYAMKVGGLELQGVEAWTAQIVPGLALPLMALIDYKGFRLVATALLPIGKDTLRYGSNDGGKTVLASDPVLNAHMERAGSSLNLKKHQVGQVELYGPGDIEGHIGRDGRYYLLDFARTMPPEAPLEAIKKGAKSVPRSVFYKMLRPELVVTNPVPLSSDVFSGWGAQEKDRRQSQKDNIAATRRIFKECIPALSMELEKYQLESKLADYFKRPHRNYEEILKQIEEIHIASRMHIHGINLRHLGRLRRYEKAKPNTAKYLLSLAVARVLKAILRERLRKTMRTYQMSETACRHLVADYFNELLFGDSSEVGDVSRKAKLREKLARVEGWDEFDIKAELERKYAGILLPEEMDTSLTQWRADDRICFKLVVSECLSLQIMKLTPEAMKTVFKTKDFANLRFVESDIAELCARVRFSHNFQLWDAQHMQRQAKDFMGENMLMICERVNQARAEAMKFGTDKAALTASAAKLRTDWTSHVDLKRLAPANKQQAKRLLKKSEKSLFAADNSFPLCPMSSLLRGDVLTDLTRLIASVDKAQVAFEQAYIHYERCTKLSGGFLPLFITWALTLELHASRLEQVNQHAKAQQLRKQAAEKMEQASDAMVIPAATADRIACVE